MFLLPALLGLLGMLLLIFGREGSTTTLVIALVILIPMAVWGALGFGEVNENGELNGGCTVTAASDSDTTTVDDTSRSDPFGIDLDGGLTWEATSPSVFAGYDWQINVVLGGIPVPIESGTETNEDASLVNGGDTADVGEDASDRGINIDLLVGIYEVGGSAATCDGFGFVEISGDGLDLITIMALVIPLLLIIIVAVLIYPGRPVPTTESVDVVDEETSPVPEASEDIETGPQDIDTGPQGIEAGSEDLPKRDDPV